MYLAHGRKEYQNDGGVLSNTTGQYNDIRNFQSTPKEDIGPKGEFLANILKPINYHTKMVNGKPVGGYYISDESKGPNAIQTVTTNQIEITGERVADVIRLGLDDANYTQYRLEDLQVQRDLGQFEPQFDPVTGEELTDEQIVENEVQEMITAGKNMKAGEKGHMNRTLNMNSSGSGSPSKSPGVRPGNVNPITLNKITVGEKYGLKPFPAGTSNEKITADTLTAVEQVRTTQTTQFIKMIGLGGIKLTAKLEEDLKEGNFAAFKGLKGTGDPVANKILAQYQTKYDEDDFNIRLLKRQAEIYKTDPDAAAAKHKPPVVKNKAAFLIDGVKSNKEYNTAIKILAQEVQEGVNWYTQPLRVDPTQLPDLKGTELGKVFEDGIKITVMTFLFTKWNMNIDTGHTIYINLSNVSLIS
jgi:hypothetical protein